MRRTVQLLSAHTLLSMMCAAIAEASFLLPTAVGAPDMAVVGAAVAEPLSPEGAMFQNPAGLVAFDRKITSGAMGVSFGEDHIESEPSGYSHTDDVLVWVPSGGISVPLAGRWRFAAGMHGAAGASLDFPADPPALENGFFTESATVAVPLALAYELRSDVWLGAELVPLFGYLRNRFPLTDPQTGETALIKYSLRGPGIQAMLGATWRPNSIWSFGLGVRTPGAVWMDGSTALAGERHDVEVAVQMPAQIFAGLTVHVTRALDLMGAARWTDASTFGDSDIEFDAVALPFVPDAKDEWRFSLGGSFDVSERLALSSGVSYGSRIVGNRGISPALFDTEDVKLAAGLSWRSGPWTLHGTAGYSIDKDSEVSAGQALVLAGRYQSDAAIVLFGVTYER